VFNNAQEALMYQGHLSDGSGIQKHSAGAWYPLVVGFRETAAPGLAPRFAAEVSDPSGAVIHAHVIGGQSTREQRLAVMDSAQTAAVRLSRLYRQAQANR